MLSLSRRDGEGLILKIPGYDDVFLRFELRTNRVIGVAIDAPKAIRILRDELCETDRQERDR